MINKLHKLEDILLIGIISVICASDTWKDMESFAIAKEDFLRSFLDLPNGVPSDDTFNRVFSSIDSEQFEACFRQWVSHLVNLTEELDHGLIETRKCSVVTDFKFIENTGEWVGLKSIVKI